MVDVNALFGDVGTLMGGEGQLNIPSTLLGSGLTQVNAFWSNVWLRAQQRPRYRSTNAAIGHG